MPPPAQIELNGVRQGGVLALKMFVIYVDDLSLDPAMFKSGCYIDDQCMNHEPCR